MHDEAPRRTIAADLRKSIQSGEYRPGHQLPSGSTLAERYGVSRQTVHKAIDLLRAEGLIEGRQGAGWFVREKPAVIRVGPGRFKRSEREAGRGATLTDAAQSRQDIATSAVEIRFEAACERIATELHIERGDEVTVRDRVFSSNADGQTIQLATSYLPRAVTRGTAIEHRNTGIGGLYARLEEAGHRLERFEERITGRLVTVSEAKTLKLSPGSPVLAVTRTAFRVDGQPLEVNDMVLAADRYELVYDLPAD